MIAVQEDQPRLVSLRPFVDPYTMRRPVNWDEIFGSSKPLEVEIGCGLGEFLTRRALAQPECRLVGIDLEWKRVYKALEKIQSTGLSNVRVMKIDAWVAFERLFGSRSIARIHSLFPCPWPKKKHTKHRLFSGPFFNLINNRLVDGGGIKIVTDQKPYVDWFLEEAHETGFKIESRVIKAQYGTKFERKWESEGQEDFFEVVLNKVKHIDVSVKEDMELKSFSIKDFSPESFRMGDEKNGISVIFKDFVFDSKQNKALVHVIVSEEHLVQNVWIAIVKVRDRWKVALEKGFRVFPTPGVKRALEIVYEAAKSSIQTTTG